MEGITRSLISRVISLPNSTVKAVSPQERYRRLTAAKITGRHHPASLSTHMEIAMAAAPTNAGYVNINSDLGESFGPWKMGNDAEILKIVRTANVACGFHGGDPTVMVETVRLCVENGVSIGAHPASPTCRASAGARSSLPWPNSRPTSPTSWAHCRRSPLCAVARLRT